MGTCSCYAWRMVSTRAACNLVGLAGSALHGMGWDAPPPLRLPQQSAPALGTHPGARAACIASRPGDVIRPVSHGWCPPPHPPPARRRPWGRAGLTRPCTARRAHDTAVASAPSAVPLHACSGLPCAMHLNCGTFLSPPPASLVAGDSWFMMWGGCHGTCSSRPLRPQDWPLASIRTRTTARAQWLLNTTDHRRVACHCL
jgi:hypothetical protein